MKMFFFVILQMCLFIKAESLSHFFDRHIDDIFIIMTHNSLATPFKVSSPNQNFGLAKQFKDGVRGFNFDLYMEADRDRIKTCNDKRKVWCYNPSEAIHELIKELKREENHNEFIIILLQSELNDEGNAHLSQLFGTRLVKNFDKEKTFGEYTMTGKQVLIFTDKNANPSLGLHEITDFITENEYSWKHRYKPPNMNHRRGPTSGRYMRLMNYHCSLIGTGDWFASRAVHSYARALGNIEKFKSQSYAGGKVNGLLVDYYETGDLFKVQDEIRSNM